MQARGDAALGTPKAVFYSAAHMLELLPAVDAEPVRHGHWEKGDPTDANPYIMCCSECGKLGLSDWVCCPRCGAKMDGSISKAALSEAAAKARREKPIAPNINRSIRYFEDAIMDGDDT